MLKTILKIAAITFFFSFTTVNSGKAQTTGTENATVRSFLNNTEVEVVKEINLARTNPQKYAVFLKKYLSFITGDKYQRPGECPLYLHEGKKAVEEAISILESAQPLKALKASKGLSAAAKDHAQEQGKTGDTGHYGANGSQTADRVEKYGQWIGSVGENCTYGPDVPRDIVVDLIIDDGIADRGHRKNIFSDEYTAVGVAVVEHSKYGTVCVQDFAGGFKLR